MLQRGSERTEEGHWRVPARRTKWAGNVVRSLSGPLRNLFWNGRHYVRAAEALSIEPNDAGCSASPCLELSDDSSTFKWTASLRDASLAPGCFHLLLFAFLSIYERFLWEATPSRVCALPSSQERNQSKELLIVWKTFWEMRKSRVSDFDCAQGFDFITSHCPSNPNAHRLQVYQSARASLSNESDTFDFHNENQDQNTLSIPVGEITYVRFARKKARWRQINSICCHTEWQKKQKTIATKCLFFE